MGILDNFLDVGVGADFVTPALHLARVALGQTQPVAVPLDLMVDVELVLRDEGFRLLYPTIMGADDLFGFAVPKSHWSQVRDLLRREFGLVYR